jgi:hypothetical protein
MAHSSDTISGGFLSSPRRQKQLLWGSGAVLAAGLIAFVVFVVFPGSGNRFTDTFSNKPAQLAKKEIKMKPTAAEFAVGRKFIETAVARKNLGASYNIVHVDLKGRLTRKDWLTGNIPVISYQATNTDTAAFIPIYSYQDQGLFDIDLLAKKGTSNRPDLLFFIGMKREKLKDGHWGPWLVNYWEPHWRPPIPEAPG